MSAEGGQASSRPSLIVPSPRASLGGAEVWEPTLPSSTERGSVRGSISSGRGSFLGIPNPLGGSGSRKSSVSSASPRGSLLGIPNIFGSGSRKNSVVNASPRGSILGIPNVFGSSSRKNSLCVPGPSPRSPTSDRTPSPARDRVPRPWHRSPSPSTGESPSGSPGRRASGSPSRRTSAVRSDSTSSRGPRRSQSADLPHGSLNVGRLTGAVLRVMDGARGLSGLITGGSRRGSMLSRQGSGQSSRSDGRWAKQRKPSRQISTDLSTRASTTDLDGGNPRATNRQRNPVPWRRTISDTVG